MLCLYMDAILYIFPIKFHIKNIFRWQIQNPAVACFNKTLVTNGINAKTRYHKAINNSNFRTLINYGVITSRNVRLCVLLRTRECYL